MLDTVDFNHVQHISFTQSRLTDAVSVILSELLSYEHPSNRGGLFFYRDAPGRPIETFLVGDRRLPERSGARRIQRWTSSWTCH